MSKRVCIAEPLAVSQELWYDWFMRKTGSNKVCLQCGKEFYVPGWALRKSGGGKNRKGQLLCSIKCATLWKRGKHYSPDTEVKPGQRISPKTEFKLGQRPVNYIDGRDYEKVNSKIKKHRKVYEDYYGVTLDSKTIVHHIDGNIHNNSIDNLQAMEWGKHTKLHHKLRGHKVNE